MKTMNKTKCKTSYGKTMVVALCALLFALCFMAVALSTPNAQALANAGSQLSNIGLAQKDTTPRVLNGDVSYTVDGNTTPQTGTLDAAIQAINGGSSGTITLTQNVEIDSSSITKISKDTTLDLGTYTLAFSGGSQIYVTGTANLTVIGTSGILTNSISTTLYFVSSGTLNVTGGTFSNTTSVGANISAINNGLGGVINISGDDTKVTSLGNQAINNYNGTLNINGGTVEATAASGYGIWNQSTKTDSVNITGGTVTAVGATDTTGGTLTGAGIWNKNAGTINITGGTVTASGATGSAVFNEADGAINIGGSAKVEAAGAGGYGIFNKSAGAVTVSGGTVSAVDATYISSTGAVGAGIYNKAGGTVTVKGGEVKTALSTGSTAKTGVAIFNEAAGKIIVTSETNGGTTTSGTVTTAGSQGTSIFNEGKGTVTVSGGSISGHYGIQTLSNAAATGLIEISGGEITTTGVAIYNAYGTVNITGGKISSDVTAMQNLNTGTINLSDGTVQSLGANSNAISMFNSTNLTISGNAIVKAKYRTIYTNVGYTGTIDISGGTVSSESTYAIAGFGGGGNYIMSGGKVEAKGSDATINLYFSKATISGGEITSATEFAINNRNGSTLYLTGTPTITSGGAYDINTSTATYGTNEDGSAAYEGKNLTINYTSGITAGTTVIVNNSTDTNKFTLYNKKTKLESDGTNLKVSTSSTLAVTFNYNGAIAETWANVDSGLTVSKPKTVVSGFVVVGWYNESTLATLFDFNTPITEDITVYAKLKLDVNNVANVETTYDGMDHTVQALNTTNTNYTYTYSWTKEGSSTVVSTTNTLTYKEVSQSGNYTCEITATPKSGTGTVYTETKTVNITVSIINTAEYIAFMDAHGTAIGYDPANMTFNQYKAVKEMLAAYDALGEREKEQVAAAGDETKVTNLQAKANAIDAAVNAANAELTALKNTSIETIRTDGIAALKAKIATAKTAIDNFTALSNNFAANDLANYSAYDQAQTFANNYDAKLLSVNTALAALNNITAQGIKDTTYTLESVEAMLTAANNAFTAFERVGGAATSVHNGLTNYANLATVTTEVAGYKAYASVYSYKTTWEIATDAIAGSDLENIGKLKTAYESIADGTVAENGVAKALLTIDETGKIDAMLAQYELIIAAKNTAETALAKLGADRAKAIEEIRKGGIVAFENNLTEVAAAVKGYTDISANLKATDLMGGAVYADAPTLIAEYKAKLALANSAITALTGKTAQSIKKGTNSLADVKAEYAAATEAYNNFYAAGGDATDKHPELLGYSKIAQVGKEIAAYEGYKAFYDEYKKTWEAAANNKAKKDDVNKMETAYKNLSEESKNLLDTPEQQSIANAIATYATNNAPINTVLIVGNVLLGLLIIGLIVYLLKRNNRKKQDDTTQNN